MEGTTFEVIGGNKLSGTIAPQGAKNEALQILCAVLLTSEEVEVTNVPEILDIKNLIGLLKGLGVTVQRLGKGHYLFRANDLDDQFLDSDDFIQASKKIRGSVMLLGPLLAR